MNPTFFKRQLLDELYAQYANCRACPLGNMGRSRVVFGEGDPNSPIMFVGEGPGGDEDAQGRPFVGRSGQLLTRALAKLGVTRESVFITNVVKCRPPGNRTPLPDEAGTCKKLMLFKEIKIVRPTIICTLGSSALQAILEKPSQITKVRGTAIPLEHGCSVVPTYHPAYILRNPPAGHDFLRDIHHALVLAGLLQEPTKTTP